MGGRRESGGGGSSGSDLGSKRPEKPGPWQQSSPIPLGKTRRDTVTSQIPLLESPIHNGRIIPFWSPSILHFLHPPRKHAEVARITTVINLPSQDGLLDSAAVFMSVGAIGVATFVDEGARLRDQAFRLTGS